MSYTVLPATIPDIGAVYSVYFDTFRNTPILNAMFPDGVDHPEFRKAHTAHTLSYWHTSSTQYTLKAVESETGKIVGMALWDVFTQPSDWVKGSVDWLQGEQKERAEKILYPLWHAREKLWSGKRYVYCHVVAVPPEYQRKGIGRLLTQWGIRVAEQAGLPVYLESSKEGRGLYDSIGFRTLKEKVVHNREVLGEEVEEDYEVPLMVWMPKARKDSGADSSDEIRSHLVFEFE